MNAAVLEHNDFLTDDELVAIAVTSGGRWPAPLPTVDVADAGSLQRSAIRGLRSLFLRGALTDDDDGLHPRLARVAMAAHSDDALVAYVGDSRGDPLNGDFSRVVLRTNSGYLLDEMSGVGLHRFSWFENVPAVSGYLSAMAAVVSDRGLPSRYGSDAHLCFSAVTQRGATVLAVARGSVSRIAMNLDGAVVSVSRGTEDVPSAVERLLDLLPGAR
jgi:hypothetical protein